MKGPKTMNNRKNIKLYLNASNILEAGYDKIDAYHGRSKGRNTCINV